MRWDEIFSEVAFLYQFSRDIYKGVTLKNHEENNSKIYEKRWQKFLKNRTSYFCSSTYTPCPILSRLCLTPLPPKIRNHLFALPKRLFTGRLIVLLKKFKPGRLIEQED